MTRCIAAAETLTVLQLLEAAEAERHALVATCNGPGVGVDLGSPVDTRIDLVLIHDLVRLRVVDAGLVLRLELDVHAGLVERKPETFLQGIILEGQHEVILILIGECLLHNLVDRSLKGRLAGQCRSAAGLG